MFTTTSYDALYTWQCDCRCSCHSEIDDDIPVIESCVALTLQRTFPVPEPWVGFPKNVAIRTWTSLNLVLKFGDDRACFHGEEAGAAKDGKVEKE